MIKAVFIDIDETLTNSKGEISEKTQYEIRRCIQKGIKIILTSGRARKDAINYQKQIGTSPYIISSNGASCYDELKKKEIFSEPIKKKVVKQLLELMKLEYGKREFDNEKVLVTLNTNEKLKIYDYYYTSIF